MSDKILTIIPAGRKATTIMRPVACEGIGLHTGNNIRMRLLPAAYEQGVVFIRSDYPPNNKIPANYLHVTEGGELGTNIANEHGIFVRTTEHLMAALWDLKIDDKIIEIDGPEVPILSGGSEDFLFILGIAGKKEKTRDVQKVVINKLIEVSDGDKFVKISKATTPGLKVKFTGDYKSKAIGQNVTYTYVEGETSFSRQLSACRTFCEKRDVDYMKSKNLALGGSLANAIVADGDHIINRDGLHFTDECIRHKVLDAIGDFALTGYELHADIECYKSSHRLNTEVVKEIGRLVQEMQY